MVNKRQYLKNKEMPLNACNASCKHFKCWAIARHLNWWCALFRRVTPCRREENLSSERWRTKSVSACNGRLFERLRGRERHWRRHALYSQIVTSFSEIYSSGQRTSVRRRRGKSATAEDRKCTCSILTIVVIVVGVVPVFTYSTFAS